MYNIYMPMLLEGDPMNKMIISTLIISILVILVINPTFNVSGKIGIWGDIIIRITRLKYVYDEGGFIVWLSIDNNSFEKLVIREIRDAKAYMIFKNKYNYTEYLVSSINSRLPLEIPPSYSATYMLLFTGRIITTFPLEYVKLSFSLVTSAGIYNLVYSTNISIQKPIGMRDFIYKNLCGGIMFPIAIINASINNNYEENTSVLNITLRICSYWSIPEIHYIKIDDMVLASRSSNILFYPLPRYGIVSYSFHINKTLDPKIGHVISIDYTTSGSKLLSRTIYVINPS